MLFRKHRGETFKLEVLKRRPFELDGCNRRRKPAFSSVIDGRNGCCGRRGSAPGT